MRLIDLSPSTVASHSFAQARAAAAIQRAGIIPFGPIVAMTMVRRVGGVLAVLILIALVLALWLSGGEVEPLRDVSDRAEMPVASRTVGVPDDALDPAGSGRIAVERARIGPLAVESPTTLRVRYVASGSGEPLARLGTTLFEEFDVWGSARDATTDTDGVATWEDVVFDEVCLSPGGGEGPIRLDAGSVNERTIKLGWPLRVEGRVVDEQGEPAAGAVVWTNRGPRRRFAATRQAVVDADGRFAFTAYDVGRWVMVFATRDGCISSRVVTPERREDDSPAVVTLVVGGFAGDLAGTVLGPDGRPLQNALVAVLGTDARPPGDPDPVADAMGISRTAPPPSVRTEDDGRFLIHDVAPGRAVIEARCVGCAPRRERVEIRAEETADVVVRMVAGSVLRGTVRDDRGRPQDGIRVALDGVQVATSSGADGTFELRDLPPAHWTVSAWAAGGMRVTGSVELPEGGIVEWNPVFPAGDRIAGMLWDSLGAPVEEVLVSIVGIPASGTRTDTDGAFEFAQVPDGSHDLRAQLRDGTRVIVAADVVPGGQPVDARLPELPTPDASLSGRVLDADHQPLGEALVSGNHVDLGATWYVRTDSDGRFRKIGLRAGHWQLNVESGRAPAEQIDVLVASGAEHKLGAIELARPVPVEVRVATRPRPGSWILATLWGDGYHGGRCSVRGGRVELPPLRAGRYRVDVAGSDHARVTIEMVLEEGVSFEREVVLTDGVPREVAVLLRDDEAQVQTLDFATFDQAGRELLRWKDVWNATRVQVIAFRPTARRVSVTTVDGRSAQAAIDGPSIRLDLR